MTTIENGHDTNKKEKVWIAIRLTHFSLESLGVKRSHDNIIISYKERVCATTDNLHTKGIKPGMPTSTAQLLYDADDKTPCRTYEREIDTENKVREKLCNELYSYTPHIEIHCVLIPSGYEETSLLLEVSTCIQLFKNLDFIIAKVSETLEHQQLSYRYGQGHTKQIAWLLSHRDQKITIEQKRQDFITQVSDLSIEYLYEYPHAIDQLKRSGFFYFGDIIQHIAQESLHSLRTRFGKNITQNLCDIFDIDNNFLQTSLFKKPVATYYPKNIFIESIQFDYPVSNSEQLLHPIDKLLSYLTDELVQRQAQTQSICWNLYDIYQNQESFFVGFEGLYRERQLAVKLTMIQLENQPLPFEIDTLELRCEKIFPINFDTPSLVGNHISQAQQHAVATVTAKINARLGERAMFTLSPKDSHIPELSFKKEIFDNKVQRFSPEIKDAKGARPSWIFNIPVKVGKRQNELFWKGKLELLQGPERIEGMWWLKSTGRDYFVAKRDDNTRLWVFHDLYKNEWFVHGVFA